MASPEARPGEQDVAPPVPRVRPWRPRGRTVDAAVLAGYLLVGGYVSSRLWARPGEMTHADSDQMLFEWMLSRAAQALVRFENPLYSTSLNAPEGVNLMANTSVLGLGFPLAPLTLLFGSRVAFLTALVLCLAGTAAAWYLLLSRRIVRSRPAAALGGLFCGFAPGMISQATGHLHMVAQFLVPAILAVVFHPGRDRVVRRGVLLGLLVMYQVFLGEEVLVFLVLACGVFALAYAVADPASARALAGPFLGRLAVGTAVGSVLLAYPLWFQFFGPGHYRGMPFNPTAYALDLGSFATYARQSLTGYGPVAGLLSPNPTEENSFFGLALLVLCAVIAGWQWRRPLVRALTVCAVIFALLSLGDEVRVNGVATGLAGPYRILAELPLLDLAVPGRLPLICVPVIAILLAISVDVVFRRAAPDRAARVGPASDGAAPDDRASDGAAPDRDRIPVRLLWAGALTAVLLPLAPLPIDTRPAWPVPDFVATGEWRAYVPPGRTLVPVPPTSGAEATTGTYWSARTGVAFTAPGGYFIGPMGPDDRQARWGSPERPTARLLGRVASTGQVPEITEADRVRAIEDLRYWRAAIVVQAGLHHGIAVKQTVDLLLGPGRDVAGAWVWDVRPLLGG